MSGGVELLERAISYAIGSLAIVTPEVLSRPTPCRDWDMSALLAHMSDSMAALQEAVENRNVEIEPRSVEWSVSSLPARASALLAAWSEVDDGKLVFVEGFPVSAAMVSDTGALELAIHGWDVAQACGEDRPLPPTLASELLPLSTMLITSVDRPSRFAEPIETTHGAGPAEQLLAFLGRDPR